MMSGMVVYESRCFLNQCSVMKTPHDWRRLCIERDIRSENESQ